MVVGVNNESSTPDTICGTSMVNVVGRAVQPLEAESTLIPHMMVKYEGKE
jgi:hypothetical protein